MNNHSRRISQTFLSFSSRKVAYGQQSVPQSLEIPFGLYEWIPLALPPLANDELKLGKPLTRHRPLRIRDSCHELSYQLPRTIVPIATNYRGSCQECQLGHVKGIFNNKGQDNRPHESRFQGLEKQKKKNLEKNSAKIWWDEKKRLSLHSLLISNQHGGCSSVGQSVRLWF